MGDPSGVQVHSSNANMSQLQKELSKFLEDFDAVKYLLDEEVEAKPLTSGTQQSTSNRHSFYDNVTPTETGTQLGIPEVRITPSETPTSAILSTFPTPTRPVSLAEPAVAPVMTTGRKVPPSTPKRTSSSTLPHVQCTKCGHYMCRHEARDPSYPTYFTLAAPRCTSCKKYASKADEVLDDKEIRSWKVRFDAEDSNSPPPKWGGGARVSPSMRRNPENHHQSPQNNSTSGSKLRASLVIIAGAVILLSLLGIVVAVTCAFLLSALQEEVKDGSTNTGCGVQVYHGQLNALWHFNLSCDEHLNDTLADISSSNFIRAAKVYEVMLDMIFRSSPIGRDYDFSKVDTVRCSSPPFVLIHFKIYWQPMAQKDVPEPSVTLQHFLSAINTKVNDKYRVPPKSVSIEAKCKIQR